MKREELLVQIEKLNAEFKELLDNPRADEILSNDWLHDETLSIPSIALIQLVSVQLLHIQRGWRWCLVAGNQGLLEAIRLFLKESRGYSNEIRERQVKVSVARMHIASFAFGLNQDTLGWWLAKQSFQFDAFQETVDPLGKSRLARYMLELLTLRAFYFNDLQQLEGLCAITRIEKGNREYPLTSSQRIAREIFVWLSFLSEKLGRSPSISEMKMFLLQINRDLSDNDVTWSQATKFYIKWDLVPRSRKTDPNQILKIARDAKKEGPMVKVVPSWRRDPKC
jgi:hypothetical protein